MKAIIPSLFVILVVSVVILVASRYWLEPSSQENFELYTADTISTIDETYIKYLVNNILERLNEKVSKELILIGLDRVSKVLLEEEDAVEYTITFYALNKKDKHDDNNYLIYTKFTLANKEVKVSELRMGHSQEYVHPRVPVSGRGSTLYKPKQGDKVEGAPEGSSLESSVVVEEMTGETVSALELNSEIPHKEAVKLEKKNYTPFASRRNQFKWDTYGVNVMDEKKPNINGSYHGRTAPKIVPNYTPSLFQSRNTDEDYYWLFDLKQDSASRPIGT